MDAIRQLLRRVRSTGVRRPCAVTTASMGRSRTFDAYDVGADTFVFERGIVRRLGERPSVLIVPKGALRRGAPGHVMTLTTGNHSVAAFPLLDGRFWQLSRVSASKRSEVLSGHIVCANVVGGALELSQRDIPTAGLVAADRWLTGSAGLPLDAVVMGERNDATLDWYRRLGQEWRVKPLAWTEAGMRTALAGAKKRISSDVVYYHSVKGVHFLSFSEFRRLVERARTNWPSFVRGLREMVSVFEGNRLSFVRLPKHRGHHEIEFFGVQRGLAVTNLVPVLETLMADIELDRVGRVRAAERAWAAAETFRSLLARPELADDSSAAFVETLYIYVTGEIYAVSGEGSVPAFDDRRTALPGATFETGRPVLHPGADARSEILLSNLRGLLSQDEYIEYANVYELRSGGETFAPGVGLTREVVYKTNLRPLAESLVEKTLSCRRRGYGEYVLARISALRALGIGLSDLYLILKHRAGRHGLPSAHYIRRRCEGEPLDAIPASYFRSSADKTREDPDVVRSLAALMGDAAAQNMAMKKYDPATHSPLYGVGKEIYAFDYDIAREKVLPKSVTTCSVRGSFGWPDHSTTEENLRRCSAFYLACYARSLVDFARQHTEPVHELAENFYSGFAYRTRTLAWRLSVMRDRFEAYCPVIPGGYRFVEKWRFLLWSLERQERRLEALKDQFLRAVSRYS